MLSDTFLPSTAWYLTNLGCIWRTFRWTKYEKMSQNIRWYLAEKVSDIIFTLHFPVSTHQLWFQICPISNWKLVWSVWLWKLWNMFIAIILPNYYQLVLVFEVFTDGKQKIQEEYLSLGKLCSMSTGNYASNFLISTLIQMTFAG